MVLVLYNAITVPLDISFGLPTENNMFVLVEYSVDLIYAIDILATFRTA